MRSLIGVLSIFGSLLAWFSLYFLLPILTALIYGEFTSMRGFAIGGAVAIVVGLALRVLTRRYRYDLKARDAYLLRPTELEAWRAIGRLFTRVGQAGAALEWWKKLEAAHSLTIKDRRDFAEAALVAGELPVAAIQIEQLLAEREGPKALDIVLAGQLAVRRSDPVLAVDYAQRALADNRAAPYDVLSAATLVLSVTTRDSQQYLQAWKRIEDLARDPKNAASLDALTFLAREHSRAPLPSTASNISLSPGSAAAAAQSTPATASAHALSLGPGITQQPVTTMGTMELANSLENHPDARPSQKLLALQLRVEHDPALTDEYVADAVGRFGHGDDETLVALTAWLNNMGHAAKTLELLPLNRAAQRQDLFLQHINALAALERWKEVKEVLMSERFPLEPVLEHVYLATARARLGEETAATNEWQRALEAADTPEKLLVLANYAERNGAYDAADTAYSEVIRLAPQNRAAYDGRLRAALLAGQTAKAQSVTAEIVQRWPDDAAARNQDAYLRLLLGVSGEAAKAAERQAQVMVAQEPWNWSARAALGLARLRLGRKEDALAAFRDIRVTGFEPPGALAVRAAILAVNGYEKGARNDARNLGAQHLLPEERTLITPLLGD